MARMTQKRKKQDVMEITKQLDKENNKEHVIM
jgi:hypothetical protein